MPDQTAYDGHTKILGVDTNSDRAELSSKILSGAINRSFRGGRNQTRPPFRGMTTTFETKKIQEIFEKGAISGCFAYNQWKSYSRPHIVVAVNEFVMKGRVYGSAVHFSELWKGIDPRWMHSWFVQAEDRMYWQNGKDRPFGWDGYDDPYQVPPPEEDGMPLGTIMSYTNGRLVVFTEDNFAIISDYIYGNGLKDTKGVEKFVEFQQFNDSGAIGSPAYLGEPMGAISIPQMDTINGQGQLLVVCKNGAYTLDPTGDRSEWGVRGIQKPALIGRGGASSYAIVAANNDVWYQSTDGGISSYKFERSERERAWGDTSLSREVSEYLKFTSPERLQFVSMENINNRLLTTCAIQLETCDMGGAHRYGLGIVSLDFDKGSTVNAKPGFAWDGLWTGIRPIQLLKLVVDGGTRGFAVSHDIDGINRVYEILDQGYGDELNGKKKSIVSTYVTPFLFEQQEPTEASILKELIGGHLLVSDVSDEASVKLSYRPDFYPNWVKWMEERKVGCSESPQTDAKGNLVFPDIEPASAPLLAPTPQPESRLGSNRLTNIGYHFQVRADITGEMTVNVLTAKALVKLDRQEESCGDAPKRCDPLRTEGENFFNYSIA